MKFCPECGHAVAPEKVSVSPAGYIKYTQRILRHDPSVHPDECKAVWMEETSTLGVDDTYIRRIDP